MKIHCLCIVRDEIDVLKHTLDAALPWAHAIYVSDNGSTDGTWELLQDYHERYPEIILAERELGPYREAVWGEMANQFAAGAKAGDWWCRLDADEIYIDDPRVFLASIPKREQIVWSASVQYYFTDVDLAAYERDPRPYLEAWEPDLLRFYSANWSEPRFVRHQPGLRWSGNWPENFYQLRSAGKRIRLRHYQYRSPPQIERRLRLRLQALANDFRHEKSRGWMVGGLRDEHLVFPEVTTADAEPWRSRVIRSAALDRDEGTGEYRIDWESLPRMWGRDSLLRRMLWGMRQRWRHAAA